MTDLPTRIEAGEATDAEVAKALGWRMKSYPIQGVTRLWFSPDDVAEQHGLPWHPPSFTTCLTTLAKECERRGWKYTVSTETADGPTAWVKRSPTTEATEGIAATVARAFAAALVRATEADNG